MTFGTYIRNRRKELNLKQRDVAIHLDMDSPLYSKIERDKRPLKKELVSILAGVLQLEYDQLKTVWLADKVYDLLKDEDSGPQVLKVAEEALLYGDHHENASEI